LRPTRNNALGTTYSQQEFSRPILRFTTTQPFTVCSNKISSNLLVNFRFIESFFTTQTSLKNTIITLRFYAVPGRTILRFKVHISDTQHVLVSKFNSPGKLLLLHLKQDSLLSFMVVFTKWNREDIFPGTAEKLHNNKRY
jgi:hypothetical protein